MSASTAAVIVTIVIVIIVGVLMRFQSRRSGWEICCVLVGIGPVVVIEGRFGC